MTSSHFIPLLFWICLDLPHFVPNVFQLSTCFRNMFIMHIENITCIQFSMCVSCFTVHMLWHVIPFGNTAHYIVPRISLVHVVVFSVETGGDPLISNFWSWAGNITSSCRGILCLNWWRTFNFKLLDMVFFFQNITNLTVPYLPFITMSPVFNTCKCTM